MSKHVSQGLQGRETNSRPLLSPRSCYNNVCWGGELREAAKKKEAAIEVVGKTSTGSGTRLVNLPWQFNEDVYKPERDIERRQKYFRFRPKSNRSIGHTFIFRRLWFCRSPEIIAKLQAKRNNSLKSLIRRALYLNNIFNNCTI